MNPNEISVWATRIIQNIVEVNIAEKREVGPSALGLGPAKSSPTLGEIMDRPTTKINGKRPAQNFLEGSSKDIAQYQLGQLTIEEERRPNNFNEPENESIPFQNCFTSESVTTQKTISSRYSLRSKDTKRKGKN